MRDESDPRAPAAGPAGASPPPPPGGGTTTRRQRRPSRLSVTGTAACAAALAGTALGAGHRPHPGLGLPDAAYLAGFAAVILTATPAAALFVTDALIERFGLLTIIVLGETLTGVVTGLADEPLSALSLSVGLAAAVVGFGAWWTYFDFAGHRHPRPKRPACSGCSATCRSPPRVSGNCCCSGQAPTPSNWRNASSSSVTPSAARFSRR